LSTIYNISDDDDEHQGLIKTLQERNREGSFSTLTSLSLMVFYVFACQCMSTLAVCKRETGSWGWTLGMFGYMTALAYIASLVTYQGGKLFIQ
jgi:ferrous iron transport protein B